MAGFSALVVVLLLLAWPASDGGESLNAIAKAAERTREESGGRATMRAVVSSPDPSESMTMRGEIVFDDAADRSRGIVRFPDPESEGTAEMEVVYDGAVMYFRSDSFGSLPEGADWVKVDLLAATGLEAPLSAPGEPEDELALLEATGDTQKVGREKVRGVSTIRYRSTIEASERAEELREEGAEELASILEEEGAPIEVEAWIDGGGLVRRMRMVQSRPTEEGGAPTTVDMRMDFFDFGPVPVIEPPDEDDVFDATSATQDALDEAAEG
jgi:hypothetical protein